MANVKYLLAGAAAIGGLTLLAIVLSPKGKEKPPKRISVITPTSRTEDFTNFPKFQKTASEIRRGGNPRLANDDDPRFKPLLVRCVKDNQRTFLQATAESLELQTFPNDDFEWVIVDVWDEQRRKYTEGRYSFKLKHVYADDTVIFTPSFLGIAWYWYQRGFALKGYRHKFREDLSIDREFEDFWLRGGIRRHALSQIWGHILAVPLEWELEVNGWEEFLDGAVGAEDIEHGFRLERSYGNRCILDSRALVYELGGFHIHTGRPHVRSNGLLLEYVYGKNCAHVPRRGNAWRPTRGSVDGYILCFKREYAEGRVGEMKAGMGDRPHPFVYKTCDVPTLDLCDLRERYRAGEFRW